MNMDEEENNVDVNDKGQQFDAKEEKAILTLDLEQESTAAGNRNLNNVLSSDALISDAH